MRNRIRSVAAAAFLGTAATGAAAQQGQAVQWRTEDGGNGHWYQVVVPGEPPTWDEARLEAIKRGGYLACANSADELSAIAAASLAVTDSWRLSSYVTNRQMGPWLGGFIGPTGSGGATDGWLWVDGTLLSCDELACDFNQWNCGGLDGREDKAHLIQYSAVPDVNAGTLVNDLPARGFCEPQVGPVVSFVIEWSADCNNDSIVDYGQIRDGTLADTNGNNVPDVCEWDGFVSIDLSDFANLHRANIWTDPAGFVQGATYPTGIASYDGVPMTHGSDLAYGWTAAPEFHGGTTGTLTVPIAMPAGMDIHLALSIWARWPANTCSKNLSVTVTAALSDGTAHTYVLRGGVHLRDHNQSGSGGGICNLTAPNVREVWRNSTNQVLDLITLHVPASDSQVVSLTFSSPDYGFWTMLFGITVEPLPDCNGDGISDEDQVRAGELADYNSNLVPDCCESGDACVVGNYPVQWREADGGNGHWYMAVRPFGTVTDWEMARAYASARGGYLMTVTSAGEQALLERLFAGSASCQGDFSGVFLGGRQPTGNAAGANWGWITGEPWGYTNWASSEPNDFGGFPEDYLMMVTQDMRWYDIVLGGVFAPCAYSAVVEWSADCDGDGIADKGQILQGQFLDVDGNGVPDTCECAGDVNDSGAVDGVDLAALLGAWGTDGQGQFVTDLDGDGIVGGADLAYVLGGWGPCQ